MIPVRAHRIALALACTIPLHQAVAQTTVPGARVRVVDASSNSLLTEGELVRLSGDSVIIATAANLASSATRTAWVVGGRRRLEVRTGLRRRTSAGALIGVAVGAAVGAAITSASWTPCEPGPGMFGGMNCMFAVSHGSATALGACGGGMVGTLIGGLIGHGIKTETWQPMNRGPVRMAIVPAAGRGVRFAASVAF